MAPTIKLSTFKSLTSSLNLKFEARLGERVVGAGTVRDGVVQIESIPLVVAHADLARTGNGGGLCERGRPRRPSYVCTSGGVLNSQGLTRPAFAKRGFR